MSCALQYGISAGRRVTLGIAAGFVLLLVCRVAPVDAGCQEDIMPNNPLVQQAIADLARRESVAAGTIELVSYEEVTWPDASLGCPQPGMRYKQVPQDGARITLRFAGGTRIYHSGGSRPPFPCSTASGR